LIQQVPAWSISLQADGERQLSESGRSATDNAAEQLMSFANQIVLITGAAQGIGRELARQFAAEGAKIAGIDVDADSLKSLESELSGNPVATAVADVTDRNALLEAVRGLEQRLGPVDLLIANAGIGRETSALTFDGGLIESHIQINLIGVANSVGAVLPGMIERRSGHLVAMSSVASYRGLPRMAGYCASKAGVNALFDALRVELKPHNIAVTVICPAWIRTAMTAKVTGNLDGLLEVDDAARRMIAAIRNRRPYVTFPAQAAWRVRLLRWLPTSISDWLVEKHFQKMMQNRQ
jgi:short-subunit dehydrogenase